MMKVLIYARCSTLQQNPENQLNELRQVAQRFNWSIVNEYVDKGISGSKGRDKRVQFDDMLKSAMRGYADLVMFWSIDRASRNLSHLVEMMNDLHAKNIGMYFHQQNIDSTTSSGRAMLQMAGVFAEFERSMLKERILASHERARAEGKTIGRKSIVNDGMINSVKFMREQGMGIRKIASTLNIGVGTVYRAMEV